MIDLGKAVHTMQRIRKALSVVEASFLVSVQPQSGAGCEADAFVNDEGEAVTFL